jgi:hypothetical protein
VSLITFLLLLLDLGKAEGGIAGSMKWLTDFINKVKAELPSEALDYIAPAVDELHAELDGRVSKIDLLAIVKEIVDFFTTGHLGPPDRRAGLIV